MKKAAVLMAEGYEEGETLTVVDLLRRAGVECHTFSFGEDFVKSTHGMHIKADKVFSDEVKDYDLIFLPGGNPGGIHLRENPEVLDMVRWFDAQGKYVAAMCMGTTVLEEAGIIRGRNVTGYTGYAEKLKSGAGRQSHHQPGTGHPVASGLSHGGTLGRRRRDREDKNTLLSGRRNLNRS